MVQIIGQGRTKPLTSSQRLGMGLSGAFNQYLENAQQQKATQAENEAAARLGMNIEGISDPKARQEIFKELAKMQSQNQLLEQLGLTGGMGQSTSKIAGLGAEMPSPEILQTEETEAGERPINVGIPKLPYTEQQITAATAINPALGSMMQRQNEQVLSEARHREEQIQKADISARKEAREERKFQTGLSQKEVDKANQLRESIPRKEMSLNFARDAIESGNMGFFSLDKLADITGKEVFRTAKGAQLITASKENLLANMGRVSSRGQNMWFEQRLNSMFPKIGQSKEANLTVQEMLESEVAMDKAYLDLFSQEEERDIEKYGYVKGDIARRVHKALEPYNKEIFNRATYRMREIEEREMSSSKMNSKVGKDVPRGTPLTQQMAKLYIKKFGKDAKAVAKKNGYHIPTYEEYQRFALMPQEFREELINE